MILSDAEIYKRCERSIPTMQDVAKIQHAETLRQLEKEGMLVHDEVLVVEDGDEQLVGCKLDCRACAKLREVRA